MSKTSTYVDKNALIPVQACKQPTTLHGSLPTSAGNERGPPASRSEALSEHAYRDAAPVSAFAATAGSLSALRSRSLENLAGWGGRIRTSVCRNQNPVPYHLATPHQGTAAVI